jgi:hypothetical protein
VQIKATFKDNLSFRATPDYYLGFKLYPNGNYDEVYNGPWPANFQSVFAASRHGHKTAFVSDQGPPARLCPGAGRPAHPSPSLARTGAGAGGFAINSANGRSRMKCLIRGSPRCPAKLGRPRREPAPRARGGLRRFPIKNKFSPGQWPRARIRLSALDVTACGCQPSELF